MKRIFTILMLCLSMVTASAQELGPIFPAIHDTVIERANAYAKIYADKLSLTHQQRDHLAERFAQFIAERDRIKNSIETEELIVLNEEEGRAIQEILTPEQYELYIRLKPSVEGKQKKQ